MHFELQSWYLNCIYVSLHLEGQMDLLGNINAMQKCSEIWRMKYEVVVLGLSMNIQEERQTVFSIFYCGSHKKKGGEEFKCMLHMK